MIGLLLKKIPDKLDRYLQNKFPDYFNLKEKIKRKGDPMFDLFGDNMENVLDEFLYKKDTPIDMEEVFVDSNSWVINREIKDLRLRDRLKVYVIGITEANGKFVQMPKGNTSINSNCKLLLVGSQRGIARAKRIINLTKQPEDI